MKYLIELSLVILLFPVWFVVGLIIAASIWIFDGLPVFFVQTRVGRDCKLFALVKFRTMRDGEVRSLGTFLRKASLDEIPEVLNVVRGEMSLVGPRPLLPEYLPYYSKDQIRRHDVLPGITGLAQVSGRNDLSWNRRFEYDLEYVRRRSLLLDICILFRTIIVVIKGVGSSRANPDEIEIFSDEAK